MGKKISFRKYIFTVIQHNGKISGKKEVKSPSISDIEVPFN